MSLLAHGSKVNLTVFGICIEFNMSLYLRLKESATRAEEFKQIWLLSCLKHWVDSMKQYVKVCLGVSHRLYSGQSMFPEGKEHICDWIYSILWFVIICIMENTPLLLSYLNRWSILMSKDFSHNLNILSLSTLVILQDPLGSPSHGGDVTV